MEIICISMLIITAWVKTLELSIFLSFSPLFQNVFIEIYCICRVKNGCFGQMIIKGSQQVKERFASYATIFMNQIVPISYIPYLYK